MSSKSQNDIKRNRILFDFESIVDVKLSFIKKYYIDRGQDTIRDDQLNKYKIYHLYFGLDLNKFCNGDRSLLKDLIHPKYLVFTSMKRLIEEYINSNGLINPVVLCKDEFQQRIIKESIPKANTIVTSRKNVKTINFSRIVLGEVKHALEFRDPITVNFMFLNFRENFTKKDPTLLDSSIVFKLGDVNDFTIANAYPEIQEPKG